MKKYIIISGFSIHDNNRGTAALGYGAISFLQEIGCLDKSHELLNFSYANKIWKYKSYTENISIQGIKLKRNVIYVSSVEKKIFDLFGITFPWTKFGELIRKVELVANINGGDGFSDIYGTKKFRERLPDTLIAIKYHIPYILLPQTLGPFKELENSIIAEKILRGAQKIYIRDDKFVNNLKRMGLRYELTTDLSVYMKPEPWNIDIKSESIGINISGLAYGNCFPGLANQFECYPELIREIINFFQEKGKNIYLIPHSYNYNKPEVNNDDLIACRSIYNSLIDKRNVAIVDVDLTSPQIKYLISKMSFFIGTRMHANFAAIYTNVPLFGLTYSYKFKGAFDANGLDGEKQTAMINNISNKDIPDIIRKIKEYYCSYKSVYNKC